MDQMPWPSIDDAFNLVQETSLSKLAKLADFARDQDDRAVIVEKLTSYLQHSLLRSAESNEVAAWLLDPTRKCRFEAFQKSLTGAMRSMRFQFPSGNPETTDWMRRMNAFFLPAALLSSPVLRLSKEQLRWGAPTLSDLVGARDAIASAYYPGLIAFSAIENTPALRKVMENASAAHEELIALIDGWKRRKYMPGELRPWIAARQAASVMNLEYGFATPGPIVASLELLGIESTLSEGRIRKICQQIE
ncbi:MAG: hypothetical protein ACRBC3_19070 [Burkholderiaceae bacterium]